MSSAWPATPATTWPSSTKAKPWRCITPNGWLLPASELSCTPIHVTVMHSRLNIVDPPLGRLTEFANDARHPNWNNRCRLAGGHSLLQPLSEKYCYGEQFPRMRPCEKSGNRNGRRHQLVEFPQTTPLLVVRDRSGWRCWLGVGEAPRRGPSTSGLYRFHPRPSAYRDRSRLGHQLGVRSSCRSSIFWP